MCITHFSNFIQQDIEALAAFVFMVSLGYNDVKITLPTGVRVLDTYIVVIGWEKSAEKMRPMFN